MLMLVLQGSQLNVFIYGVYSNMKLKTTGYIKKWFLCLKNRGVCSNGILISFKNYVLAWEILGSGLW